MLNLLQISNITTKANRILNLLRRHFYGCNQEVKSRAFTSDTCSATSGIFVIGLGPLLQARHFDHRKSTTKWYMFCVQHLLLPRKCHFCARLSSGAPFTRKTESPNTDTVFTKPPTICHQSPVKVSEYVTASSGRTRTHYLTLFNYKPTTNSTSTVSCPGPSGNGLPYPRTLCTPHM